MSKPHGIRRLFTALAASFALVCVLSPLPSQAREGSSSKSVGKGIKCRTVVTTDKVTGQVTATQVCAKGV
jgi:hypothetical protein